MLGDRGGGGWGGAAAAPERALVQHLVEPPAPSLDTPPSLAFFLKTKRRSM